MLSGSDRRQWMFGGMLLLVGTAFGLTRTGDDRYGVWFYPVPASEPRRLFVNTGHIVSLAVSPDGRRIAYTSQRQSLEVWALENFLPSVGRK